MNPAQRFADLLSQHTAQWQDGVGVLVCSNEDCAAETLHTADEWWLHLAQVLVDTLGIEEEWGLYAGHGVFTMPRQMLEGAPDDQHDRIRTRLVSGWVAGE